MMARPIDLGALRQQRWFGAKDRPVVAAHVVDRTSADSPLALALVEVVFGEGASERYALVPDGAGRDAFGAAESARALLGLIRSGASLPTERGGVVHCSASQLLASLPAAATEPPRLVGVEQSNSSLRYGDAFILKLFRRVAPGTQPEIEVGRFLTERAGFGHVAALAGAIEYRGPDDVGVALAVLQAFVPNSGDAWHTTLQRLAPVLAGGPLGPSLDPVRRLAEVTGELHLALASVADDPDFAPQTVVAEDVAAWTAQAEAEVRRAQAAAGGEVGPGQPAGGGIAPLIGTLKIRHHGDYHLGQVLETRWGGATDFVVIDFEGEPARSLAARRGRHSALRDVAGMLRSLDYARHAALRSGDVDDGGRARRAAAWHEAARRSFTSSYVATVRGQRPALLPASDQDLAAALSHFEREKAAYEVLYELNHRPDWVAIPVAALRGTLAYAS